LMIAALLNSAQCLATTTSFSIDTPPGPVTITFPLPLPRARPRRLRLPTCSTCRRTSKRRAVSSVGPGQSVPREVVFLILLLHTSRTHLHDQWSLQGCRLIILSQVANRVGRTHPMAPNRCWQAASDALCEWQGGKVCVTQ
jgi:hypothetical protein